MNCARLGLAAVSAAVVDFVYGGLVYGRLMTRQFAAFPAVFRSVESQMGYLPAMFCGILVGMLAITAIYAKGYEGGSGVAEGVRFGVLVGIFNAGYFAASSYAILNVGRSLALSMAVAGLVEWLIVGVTIGLVYKPLPAGAAAR